MKLVLGDCLEELKKLPDNSVDSIITDPPYDLTSMTRPRTDPIAVEGKDGKGNPFCRKQASKGFMGKEWDGTGIAFKTELWQECLRVLKSGGHLIAFGGCRTYHRMAVAIEDAGFEVRDMIEWIYASGFPKSLNVGKAVDKICGETGRKEKFVEWMKTTGLTPKIVDDKLKECGVISQTSNFAIHYFNLGQPAIPTMEMWKIVRPICGEIPQWVDELVERIEREREVIGNKPWDTPVNGFLPDGRDKIERKQLVETKGSSEWEGFGTALKPAHESILLAQKPLTSVPFCDILSMVVKTIGGALCQLEEFVINADCHLKLNLQGQKEAVGIAQWIADENTSISDILSVLTATSQFAGEEDTSWDIVLLWLNILAEIYGMMSKFTTSTEIALTTELQILKSLPWLDIFQNITARFVNQASGNTANVLIAESLFNAVKLKLDYIRTHSAQDLAILKGGKSDSPHSPIVLARKPLSEKTVVENCLKHRTGAVDIDGCRIPINEDVNWNAVQNGRIYGDGEKYGKADQKEITPTYKPEGRFPANIICTDDALNDGVITGGGKMTIGGTPRKPTKHIGQLKANRDNEIMNFGDSGSKSRYFDIDVWAEKHGLLQFPKASKRERNEGCEGLEEKQMGRNQASFDGGKILTGSGNERSNSRQNHHPTVKPVHLMAWLVRLVTPPDGVCLDPFMGSGTTGVACKKLGRGFIGIEKEPEYMKIAEARINGTDGVLL